ncbi:MAG: nicotinate-nucleotide adenylyltransferase [Pseudomonadota bacterium]
MKNIGLFGGTFNPVHFGHLRSAAEVRVRFLLDKVCFIPSAIPPHKSPSRIANAKDRFEMLKIAIKSYPEFYLSNVELNRQGPSYTIDTVKYFQSDQTEPAAYYLILGLDAFLEIDTWKSFKELFRVIPFIVMTRPGLNYCEDKDRVAAVSDFLNTKISDGYLFSKKDSVYTHKVYQPVYMLDITPIDISSTNIRTLIKNKEPVSFFMPEDVELFVKNNGLYI